MHPRRRSTFIVSVAAASALAFTLRLRAAEPAATQPTAQELADQIKALQAKVEQLQQQQLEQQKAQSADVNATVERVLRDADKRSQNLLASNWQNGKFLLRSDDGNYVLHPWFQLQIRYGINDRDNVDGGSDTESGFELRRMKFGIDGNVFSPDVTYLINWATNRNTGSLELEEAWIRAKFADNLFIKGGQMKDPFAHESIISSKKLMAAERTLLTDNFTGGDNYVQGVSLAYAKEALQGEVAFTDGANSINNNFQDFPTNSWDFGVAGRVQYKLFGDWTSYEQFTSLNNKKDLFVVGAGVDWSEGGDTDQILHTADAQYNMTNGLGFYGAYYGRYTMNAPKSAATPAPPTSDTYDWGFIAQAAYLIPDTKWEPFLRYDFIRYDTASVAAGADNEVHEITAGVNYYLHNHDAKFTLDVTYLPNGSPVNDTGGDILTSTDSEVIFRGQFQLLL